MRYQNLTISAVIPLNLEHRTNATSRDAGGFISVGIEPTGAAQARENLRRGAEEDVKRLGNTSNNQTQANSSSARQDLGQQTVFKDQPREDASSGPKEELEPGKAKSMDHARENASAAPRDDAEHLKTSNGDQVSKIASHTSHPDFTAPGLAVPPKVANPTSAVGQNTDVVVSLGTVLNKIQWIADVTVNAVDALAKASGATNPSLDQQSKLSYVRFIHTLMQLGRC